MAVLIGMSTAIKGQKHEIVREETFIGRNAHNHIAVDDNSVSSRHCSILRDGNRYTLVDLGSTNGTRLDGQTIIKTQLYPKAIVQVGNIEFMFDGQDVEAPPAAHDTAQIEVSPGPIAVPQSFHTASPFGVRRDSRKPWAILTAVMIVLALIALVYFMKNIFSQ